MVGFFPAFMLTVNLMDTCRGRGGSDDSTGPPAFPALARLLGLQGHLGQGAPSREFLRRRKFRDIQLPFQEIIRAVVSRHDSRYSRGASAIIYTRPFVRAEAMWAARRTEALKRAAVLACPHEARKNVRFGPHEQRRNYLKARGMGGERPRAGPGGG